MTRGGDGPEGRDEARLDIAHSMWMLVGVSALFAFAIYRLGGRGLATVRQGLSGGEWAALVVLTAGFVYGEGVRALDRRWVPGLLERARHVRRDRRLVVRILAPLHGLALIGAPRRRMARAWMGTAAIVLAVAIVQTFPAPWRGITDLAVAAALTWGLAAILRGAPSVLK